MLWQGHEGVKDWIVAGVAAAIPATVTLADVNGVLTAISLLLAVGIAAIRFRRSWRYRNDPPGKHEDP
jgi:hypothetical protein